MFKALRLNLSMMLRSGYMLLFAFVLALYSLLSYAVGTNTYFHFPRHGTDAAELIAGIEDLLETAYTGFLMFVPAVFYVLPLVDVKNGGVTNASATLLSMSLPISRREYALSRFLYAVVSSLVIVMLFTGLTAAGIYRGPDLFRAEARIAIRAWFASALLMIHVAGMLTVAVFLGTEKFVVPVLTIFIAFVICARLIPAEAIYRFVSSPSYWPAVIAFTVAADAISVAFGIAGFEKRDI